MHPSNVVIVAAQISTTVFTFQGKAYQSIFSSDNVKTHILDTLKREPIEENLADLAVSSESGGKSSATNEHLEVLSMS